MAAPEALERGTGERAESGFAPRTNTRMCGAFPCPLEGSVLPDAILQDRYIDPPAAETWRSLRRAERRSAPRR
jgi:hypothetical protein